VAIGDENNLLTININASQELIVTGHVVFESVVNPALLIPSDESAIASLNVTGSADVTLGSVDTSDDHVDGLNVVNNGTGTLTLTLVGGMEQGSGDGDIDADDALSFTGSGDIVLHIEGDVDLSDDVVTAVDAIHLENGASVTLTAAQVAFIGPGDISGTAGGATENITIIDLGTTPFDASTLGANVEVTVVLAAGIYTLDPASNLADASVLIPAASTITMTVDQYMALDDLDGLNATTSKVILTGLTQAHIDAGFTLTDTDTLVGTVTLAESVVLKATTDLNGFTVVMSGTQTLSLATSTQADGLDIEGTATNTV